MTWKIDSEPCRRNISISATEGQRRRYDRLMDKAKGLFDGDGITAIHLVTRALNFYVEYNVAIEHSRNRDSLSKWAQSKGFSLSAIESACGNQCLEDAMENCIDGHLGVFQQLSLDMMTYARGLLLIRKLRDTFQIDRSIKVLHESFDIFKNVAHYFREDYWMPFSTVADMGVQRFERYCPEDFTIMDAKPEDFIGLVDEIHEMYVAALVSIATSARDILNENELASLMLALAGRDTGLTDVLDLARFETRFDRYYRNSP